MRVIQLFIQSCKRFEHLPYAKYCSRCWGHTAKPEKVTAAMGLTSFGGPHKYCERNEQDDMRKGSNGNFSWLGPGTPLEEGTSEQGPVMEMEPHPRH